MSVAYVGSYNRRVDFLRGEEGVGEAVGVDVAVGGW